MVSRRGIAGTFTGSGIVLIRTVSGCRPHHVGQPEETPLSVSPQIRPDATAELSAVLSERILILDGAMGTMIQQHRPSESDYRAERFKDWTGQATFKATTTCSASPSRT